MICIIAHMYICRINALEELLEQQKVSTDEKVAEESRKYSAALVRNIYYYSYNIYVASKKFLYSIYTSAVFHYTVHYTSGGYQICGNFVPDKIRIRTKTSRVSAFAP